MNFYLKNDASKRNIIKDHLYCKFCAEYSHIFPNLKFSVYIPIHHVETAILNSQFQPQISNQQFQKSFIPEI